MKKIFITLAIMLFSTVAFSVQPFSLPWMNNPTNPGTVNYSSSGHADSVFVIETFFKLCGACNDNAVNVNELASQYLANPKVQIISVGRDKRDKDYEYWITKHHPNHPVLKDGDQVLIGQLGTEAFPSVYILNSKLEIKFSHVGTWDETTKKELKNKISDVLND